MKMLSRLMALLLAVGLATVNSIRADTTITTFDTPGFAPVNALYASWASAATNATPTNYIILNAFTYGSLWKQLGPPPLSVLGNTNLVLDVTLDAAIPTAAASSFTVIVDLKDGQSPSTSFGYRFKGLSPGHHILVGNLFTTNVPATDNGVAITNNLYEIHTNSINPATGTLDLSQLWHLNLELDPTTYVNAGDFYSIAFNDLTLAGSSNGSAPVSNLCATIDAFDNTALAGLSGSWTNQVPTSTNLLITAAGYGDGYAAVTPVVNTDPNKTLQVSLNLSAPSTANGKLGPLVVLQDGAGNQIRFAWYGQSPGTNLVLTSLLGSGTPVVGTTFDFTTVSFFHMQLDPSSYAGEYTVAWNDVSVTGCTNTAGTGTAPCLTLQGFQNDSLNGLYGNWTTQDSTPTNLQVTASGFGGGWQFASGSTDSSKTLRVNVTLEAPSAAVGRLGPLVVLQDADGTQMLYSWYGQSPGTNLILTSLLSAGTPVSAQPGTTPGFDFTAISAFHVQLDPSSFAGTYTVAWNNLDVIGCAPPPPIVILSSAYHPSTQEFSLTWSSVTGANYAVQSALNATDAFTDLITDIPSSGSNTAASVYLSDPQQSFVRVRRQ